MYGTVARMKIQQERFDELRAVMDEIGARTMPGFRGTHFLFPSDGRDEVLMVVYFDDRESYMKNADDPAMHDDYMKYRALLDADPEWFDGEWVTYEP